MTPALRFAFVCILLAGCSTAPKSDFTITRKPIADPIAGFGVCMNPYLYAYPNTPNEISPAALADLEAKVKRLHPQFVRIFFLNSWLEGDTDASVAKNHPGMRESAIRTIRLAQESGATVLLQLWYDPGRYEKPDDVAHRFARCIATLRNDHGLTAIQYATIQNEPNEHENDDGSTMERYVQVYRAFDGALRELRLREQVKIVGGDLVGEYQQRWLEMLARELSPVLDGYSIHVYWDYWDIEKMLRHVRDTAAIVANMPAKARRPLYVTEFGAQGFRENPSIEPGKSDDGKPLADVPVYSFEMAIFLLEAINAGFVGTAQWDAYDIWYDRKMGYGVIGSVESSFKLKPGYGLLSLFTHTTEPTWRALKIQGALEDVWISALRGSTEDQLTVFALNRTRGRSKTISVSGLPPNRPFHVTFWNADETGQLTRARDVTPDRAGTVTLTIPHYALVALTASPDLPAYAQTTTSTQPSLPAPTAALPPGLTKIFDGKSLDNWTQLPPDCWTVRDNILASVGAARGVIYTNQSYDRYRIVFDVRHVAGNKDHRAAVLVFCATPKEGEKPFDALGGIQFQVPNGGSWDYRKRHNDNGKPYFTHLVNPHFDEHQWSRVEILVDPKSGTARMAVAQPPGSKAVEVLDFKDPEAGQKGPFALQMHNKGLFDEYANIAIEENPAGDELITIKP